MIDILLAGVGGQGTVLAAKVLAQAAQNKGWQVRTAETHRHGPARRQCNEPRAHGGRTGEAVYSPLITPGTADMVIALEPGEAARALPYLAPGGVLVTATTAIQPVTAALASQPLSCRRRCGSFGELPAGGGVPRASSRNDRCAEHRDC